jgi:predicted nucleic-acid-binding protein
LKAIVDTNILVRMLIRDNPIEAQRAEEFLLTHEIVVTNQTLCELVWVLKRIYRFTVAEVECAIRSLVETDTVTLDKAAVDSGLSFLRAGGDLADGIIAFEGRRLGGQVFATFDRKAAAILDLAGFKSLLLQA